MTQLGDDILGFLFNKRYMDFKTCSGLRLVSGQFNCLATKYFRSLKEFNRPALEWGSKSVEIQYACYLETATEHCKNLEKITGIRIRLGKQNLASRMCLLKLPKLTSIDIFDGLLKTSVLFDFLKLLPHLRSVNVASFENSRDEDDEAVPEEKKLVVSELSLQGGDFWRIFRVDHLKKLEVSLSMFTSDEDVTTFCGVVERCQRLEHLEMNIYMEGSSFPPSLLRLTEVLPHLKQFNLNLQNLSFENVTRMVNQYPSLGKFVKKLTIYHWASEPMIGD